MSINETTCNMDRGKLAIVPLFTLLLIVNVFSIQEEVEAFGPVSTLRVATLIHHMLIVCFYALWVLLYLRRSSAKSSTNSFIAKTVAVVATFMPFAIPALGRPANDSVMLLLADLVTMAGMVIALSSLSALGRNVSIVPQARSLVQSGPYRVVRHPLYLGELIAILGIVLARISLPAVAVFCLLAALQIYRALEEEKVLAGVFPDYDSYRLKSARFIPGVF